ncbi:MAG: DUF4296 domain-containing protein [Mangrovibacterium sp.]
MKNFFLYIAICSFILCSSCEKSKIKKPAHLPSSEEMVNILYDIHYAEAISQNHQESGKARRQNSLLMHNRNLISDSLYADILQKYDLNDSLLANSILYYSSQLKTYEEIYEKVIERINNDLTKQIYKDSITHALASEEKRRADSIAEVIRKHEEDSIAEAIHRQFIDSIAEATGRDFNFVEDSIIKAKEECLKFVADSIADAKRKHLVDSIVDITGEDPEEVADSLIRMEIKAQKLAEDSIRRQKIDSIAKATGKDALSIEDSITKAELAKQKPTNNVINLKGKKSHTER